jgi:alpha-glucosidase
LLEPADVLPGSGRRSRRILLPEGAWYDFWSDQSWLGPVEIDYPAPLDRLPLLARGGAILPLGPNLQSILDDHRFTSLQLHLWPPYPARLTFYDDDGRSSAYQNGACSQTEITAQAQGDRLSLQVSQPLISSAPVARSSSWCISARPRRVLMSNAEIPALGHI